MGIKVEQVTKPVLLGEGPHWDTDQQCLFYCSIFGHSIHKYVPATGKETKAKLPGNVGFVVPIKGTKDQFAVGIDRKVMAVKWDGTDNVTAEVLNQIAEVDTASGLDTNRLNDGKADPNGRLYAGTMGKEDPPGSFQQNKGSLFVFSKSGGEARADQISISNGLCWDRTRRIMYYIDSLEFAVRAYDYDFNTGAMTNKRVVFDYKKNNIVGLPDGMTIDTDGNLWVACFDGSQVIKVDPTSGTLLQQVPIPALQVTSVAFGGKNLDELYVTSASMNIKEEQKPPCGATFKITGLNVKGYAGDACVL